MPVRDLERLVWVILISIFYEKDARNFYITRVGLMHLLSACQRFGEVSLGDLDIHIL